MKHRIRRGFTLIELLVVITIIGMLMAILLPAVQAAREAGRRTTCMNNQKNLAVAAILYQASMGHFPSCVTLVGGKDATWVVSLFPYMERKLEWKKWTAGKGEPLYIKLMVCPSDPPDETDNAPLSFVVNTEIFRYGLKGVTIFYVSDHDGTATTLLFSENYIGAVSGGRSWFESTEAEEIGFNTDEESMGQNVGSNHGGGVNVAFCSGSVRFLRDDIGNDIYRALVTPAGDETISDDDFD